GERLGLVEQRAVEGDPSPDEFTVLAAEPGGERTKARSGFLRREASEALNGEEHHLARGPGLRQVAVALEKVAWIARRTRERLLVQRRAPRQVAGDALCEAHLPVLQGEPDARPDVVGVDS